MKPNHGRAVYFHFGVSYPPLSYSRGLFGPGGEKNALFLFVGALMGRTYVRRRGQARGDYFPYIYGHEGKLRDTAHDSRRGTSNPWY